MSEYKKIQETINFIKSKTDFKPEIGLILGSGLGEFANSLENKLVIPFHEIPHFPVSKVVGHAGNLILGTLKDIQVVIMQGRVHYYEGHEMNKVVYPARVLVGFGCKKLIITNAAGGIGPDLFQGDLCLITDHLNLMGSNPLRGPNEEELGTRFPDMSNVYNGELRNIAIEVAKDFEIDLKKGIYAAMPGPTYETPAEVQMAKIVGANLVGMSTVPEAIAASHMGAKILGISCVTNLAAGISKTPLNHSEVKETAVKIAKTFEKLIRGIIFKF
jgi:purine-nucleoside phosphorylase